MIEEITDEQLHDVLARVSEWWLEEQDYTVAFGHGEPQTLESADRGKYTIMIRSMADDRPVYRLWLSLTRVSPAGDKEEPLSTYAIEFSLDDDERQVFRLDKFSDHNRRLELHAFACGFLSECRRFRIKVDKAMRLMEGTPYQRQRRQELLELWEILGSRDDGTMGLHTDDASYLAVRVDAKMFLRTGEQRYEIEVESIDDGLCLFDLSSLSDADLSIAMTVVRSLLRVRREIVGGQND